MNGLLAELDFSHVKSTDANNVIVFVDDCWCLSLCLGQDNVHQILEAIQKLCSWTSLSKGAHEQLQLTRKSDQLAVLITAG